jgi:hypothetical protein
MCVFHINTSIKLGGGKNEEGSHIHFAFATEQATSVQDFQARLEAGKSIYGWRLVTRRVGDNNHIKSKIATLLTQEGIAMVQDWTRGTLVDEEE